MLSPAKAVPMKTDRGEAEKNKEFQYSLKRTVQVMSYKSSAISHWPLSAGLAILT